MPFAAIHRSPLNPETDGIRLHYREYGEGVALLILHGGWGYQVYPFDRQIAAFAQDFRVLIPDRSGYGRSGKLAQFPLDFHRRAAGEMIRFLDALEIDRCVLWGHSDGAVIAAWMGIEQPSRFSGMILEAFHFRRVKPCSRSFFENTARDPRILKPAICELLSNEHGEDYWRDLIRNASDVWLRLSDEAIYDGADLFDGELSQLAVPAIFIHGSEDPRTEPDELDRVKIQLPESEVHIIRGGGHSPHSEKESYARCNFHALQFLNSLKSSNSENG